jgi:hypothetical protein
MVLLPLLLPPGLLEPSLLLLLLCVTAATCAWTERRAPAAYSAKVSLGPCNQSTLTSYMLRGTLLLLLLLML